MQAGGDMLWCPFSADWGSVADWVNILVAFGIGIAVLRLSKAANSLARNVKNGQDRFDRGHYRLLMGFLYPEIVNAKYEFESILKSLKSFSVEDFSRDLDVSNKICDSVLAVKMPGAERHFEHLSKLPGDIPENFASVLGMLNAFHTLAREIRMSQALPVDQRVYDLFLTRTPKTVSAFEDLVQAFERHAGAS